MKQFIIGKRGEENDLQLNDYIELFHKRFKSLKDLPSI